MPHRLTQFTRPVVIAHRGASAHAPENTLAAFCLALDHHADGIELDAKLSADGEVVVIHDQTVSRTTGGQGVVRQMTLAQLKALDAGSHFDKKFMGEPVPTLEEVFATVGSKMLINVEITNYTSVWDALPEKIADLVIRYELQESVFFSSFYPNNLLRIRRRLPGAPAALLTARGGAGRLLRGRLGRFFSPDFLHPFFTDVSDKMLAREHTLGRKVNVWTVNDPGDILRLFNMGIDGIITDDPLLARQIMEEKHDPVRLGRPGSTPN